MTVTWSHGERVQRYPNENKYIRHAFKNQIAGLPSICGRGRFPQDTTPPAPLPPVCGVCATKARPPDSPIRPGPYERGHVWAQYKDNLSGTVHRSPKGYDG